MRQFAGNKYGEEEASTLVNRAAIKATELLSETHLGVTQLNCYLIRIKNESTKSN